MILKVQNWQWTLQCSGAALFDSAPNSQDAGFEKKKIGCLLFSAQGYPDPTCTSFNKCEQQVVYLKLEHKPDDLLLSGLGLLQPGQVLLQSGDT